MTDPVTTTDIDNVTEEVALTPKQKRENQWKDRKRTVITTLVFCGLCIGYIMFQGKDLQVYQSIVYGCFGLAGSVIGFFIGGQTYHDINSEKINAVQNIRNNGYNGYDGSNGGGTPVVGPGPRINGPVGPNPGI
jgi:hypothetical protein